MALAACSPGDRSPPPSPPHRDEARAPDRITDTDGDGLTDFAELHKYLTNPRVPDASERYAHSYSIVDTIEIVKPIDLVAMNDDYQDARLVSETEHTAVLEVRIFPLGTAGDAIAENPRWRQDHAASPALREYLAPSTTANWDEAMRDELISALKADGIDPDRLTDRQVVEHVSAWLFKGDRFRYLNHFVSYDVVFEHGKAAVNPKLRDEFDREKTKNGLATDEQAIALGVFGKAMFDARVHGDCTASAILQTTVLRALGIPTRIVLTIPLVDGNDPDQLRTIRDNLHHEHLRNAINRGAPRNSWASHTFNEVFVGDRWVRLNYAKLGESPIDLATTMGMMVHVNTMRDWSDSLVANTWGTYAQRDHARDDAPFTLSSKHSPNPYRSLGLRDELGAKANIANPHEPFEEIDPDARFDIGFDWERSQASKRVTGVRSNSAAARAGLRDGQELAGASFSANPNERALIQVRDGTEVRDITYFPRTSPSSKKGRR